MFTRDLLYIASISLTHVCDSGTNPPLVNDVRNSCFKEEVNSCS